MPNDKTISPIPDSFENVTNSIIGPQNEGEILEAVYSGKLPIGEIELDCAVLEGGVRVLSERAIHRAFGSKRGGSHWKRMKEAGGGAKLPSFLSAKNYSPFINNDLSALFAVLYCSIFCCILVR